MSLSEAEIQFVFPARSKEPLCDMLVEITRAIDTFDEDRVAHGFLGGEHGYGGSWNTETFEMRPYYWGDCDCGFDELEHQWCIAHTHTEECYQAELRRELIAAGGTENGGLWSWIERPKCLTYDQWQKVESAIYDKLCFKHKKSRKFGAAVHCTCIYDREWKKWSRVNRHKPTCTPELPNFLHRSSGLEVRWYKYIGRGMETKNVPSDLTPVFNECIADIRAASVDTHAKRGDAKQAPSERMGSAVDAEGSETPKPQSHQ